jgi:hypothetical protein
MVNVNILDIADIDIMVKTICEMIENILINISDNESNFDLCSLRGGIAQTMMNNMVDDHHGHCVKRILENVEKINDLEFKQYKNPN